MNDISQVTTPRYALCADKSSQLIVVDIQEKLGAAMPQKVLNRVLRNTALLLRTAGVVGVPVTVSEQYPKGLGTTFGDLTASIPATGRRLEKTRFSCVGAAGFEPALADRERPQMIVAGMEAHVCVLQTAFDLAAAGCQVFVVEDAICSRKLENYENALERLRHAGVAVTSTESVIFEWLRDARHEHFKSIAALLR